MKNILLLYFFLFLSLGVVAQPDLGPPIEFRRGVGSASIIHPVDLDNDGDLDILTGSYTKLAWYKNSSGGSDFGAPIIIADVAFINDIETADFDQDGDLDIVTYGTAEMYQYFENVGNGNFSAPTTIYQSGISQSGFAEVAMQIADVDMDGSMDILAINSDGGKVFWLRFDANTNSFDEAIIIGDVGSGVSSIAYADVNGDGQKDVITANTGDDEIAWYQNLDGMGSFGSKVQLVAMDGVRTMFADDIDQDGDIDLYAESLTDDILVWFENVDGLGNFGTQQLIYDSGIAQMVIHLADSSGDGIKDLHICFPVFGDEIFRIRNLGGSFAPLITIFQDIEDVASIATGDLNGDGFPDLVLGSLDENQLLWRESDNYFFPFAAPIYLINIGFYNPVKTILQDMDVDGDLDIVVHFDHVNSSDIFIYWFENEDPFTNFQQPHFMYAPDVFEVNDLNDFSLADMDGDGDDDLLVSILKINQEFETGIFWYENLDGVGTFGTERHTVKTIFQKDLTSLTTFDLDNDGDLEVIWANRDDDDIRFKKNNGDGIFFGETIILENYDATSMTLKDFDADGDADFVISSRFGDKVSWVENIAGNGSNWELHDVAAQDGILFSDAQDMDGDGFLDIITVYDAFDSLSWIKNENGNGFTSPEVLMSDVINPVIYDFENDGDLDIIFYRDNKIYWLENIGNGEFAAPAGLTEYEDDINECELNYGDLDSDGDKDIVFYDESISGRLAWLSNLSLEPNRIVGKFFFDENDNGVQDVLEHEIGQRKIHLEPTQLTSWTNNDGRYAVPVNPGDYTVNGASKEGWYFTTDSVVAVVATDMQDTLVVDFGVNSLEEIRDMDIYVYSGASRCGFEVPFSLSYVNTGTRFLDGKVHFVLDDSVSLVSTNPMPSEIYGDSLVWDFTDLLIGEFRSIDLVLQMPSEEAIGYILQQPAYASYIFNQEEIVADSFLYESQINCAYDPNDKQVYPFNANGTNYTLFEETLLYTIRFQNTGTDTAFTVKIVDYLDDNLDWTTFRALGSSHDYIASLGDNGRVEFSFENILLPDSTTNLVGSQGYVQYEITPLPDLAEETNIYNQASIFFDFNSPIITNQTTNLLVSEYPIELLTTDPACFGEATGSIQALLPVSGFFTYTWTDGLMGEIIGNLPEGNYDMVVLSEAGAIVAQGSTNLNAPPPIAATFTTTPENGTNQNGSATVMPTGGVAPYSYIWNTIPIQTTPTADNLSTGNYSVIITDANQCEEIATVFIDNTVNTQELDNSLDISVFPNPVENTLTIHFSKMIPPSTEIRLRALDGKIVLSQPYSNKINVRHLPAGSYFLEILIEGETPRQFKVMKQ